MQYSTYQSGGEDGIKGPDKTGFRRSRAIPQFMGNFRADSYNSPKMHLLADHIIPWAKEWHVGFGLLGEQGAESIHARFNTLQNAYHSMPDKVQELLSIMKEQVLFIAPRNVAAIPQQVSNQTQKVLSRRSVLTFSMFDRCQKRTVGYKPMLISSCLHRHALALSCLFEMYLV